MTDFFRLKQPVMTPGAVIRAFRKNFGFTMEKIRNLTGINEPNQSAMESCRRAIGPDLAIRLAAVYGLDPAQILFPNGMQVLEKPELKRIQKKALALRERKLAEG